MSTGEKRISVGIAVIVFAAILSVVHYAWADYSPQEAVSKDAQPAAPGSLEAVVASLWPKISTICPVNTDGQIENMTFFHARDHMIVKVSRPWKKLILDKLTEKDRLNGIQTRAFAVLGGSAYQIRDGSDLLPWKDFPKFVNELTTGYVWTTVAVEIKHGKWAFSTYTGTSDSPMNDWSNGLDPDYVAAHRPSCDALAGRRADRK